MVKTETEDLINQLSVKPDFKAAHVRDDETVPGISTITTTSFHIHIKLMSGS